MNMNVPRAVDEGMPAGNELSPQHWNQILAWQAESRSTTKLGVRGDCPNTA